MGGYDKTIFIKAEVATSPNTTHHPPPTNPQACWIMHISIYIKIDHIDRPIDSHLDIFLQIVMVSTHIDMTMFYLGE